jgi:hypothetical protein
MSLSRMDALYTAAPLMMMSMLDSRALSWKVLNLKEVVPSAPTLLSLPEELSQLDNSGLEIQLSNLNKLSYNSKRFVRELSKGEMYNNTFTARQHHAISKDHNYEFLQQGSAYLQKDNTPNDEQPTSDDLVDKVNSGRIWN